MNDPSNNNSDLNRLPGEIPIKRPPAPMKNGPLEPKSSQADKWLSTIGSCILLGATIYLVYLYYSLFGFNLWGAEKPEHWKWLGGLVGFVAVLIRLAVIGVFSLPYIICSVVGMKMSRRVADDSRNALGIFHWFLLACHVVMLLPLGWIFVKGFGLFFFNYLTGR